MLETEGIVKHEGIASICPVPRRLDVDPWTAVADAWSLQTHLWRHRGRHGFPAGMVSGHEFWLPNTEAAWPGQLYESTVESALVSLIKIFREFHHPYWAFLWRIMREIGRPAKLNVRQPLRAGGSRGHKEGEGVLARSTGNVGGAGPEVSLLFQSQKLEWFERFERLAQGSFSSWPESILSSRYTVLLSQAVQGFCENFLCFQADRAVDHSWGNREPLALEPWDRFLPKRWKQKSGSSFCWRGQCFSAQLLFTFKSLVLSKSAYWWMYDELSAAWGLAQASWPNPLYSCCSAKRSVEVLRKLLQVG